MSNSHSTDKSWKKRKIIQKLNQALRDGLGWLGRQKVAETYKTLEPTGVRYGNKRHQVATLKVRERRNERARLNRDVIYKISEY